MSNFKFRIKNNTIYYGVDYLKYSLSNTINIDDFKVNINDFQLVESFINKLVVFTYHYGMNIVNNTNVTLVNHHFIDLNGIEVLIMDTVKINRFMKVGKLPTGKKNNICDCKGVRVGHFTIHDHDYHTGVTVVSPHEGNIFKEKVVGASYTFNGFGKSIGLLQVDELGTIESNIALTSTLNVCKIGDGVVNEALSQNPEIGITTGTINPICMECNDSTLNKSRDRILGRKSYYDALKVLDYDFREGDIGAGSGMICHGFKGGIGSSSRIIKVLDKEYTLGILVNSNFGDDNGKSLILNGEYLGDKFDNIFSSLITEEKGSIIVIVATDAPFNERQIKRILKRAEIGIGRTGSYAGNGSGDVFIGFSTANKRLHFAKEIDNIEYLSDNYISPFFKGVVEGCEEAIINSMLSSHHLKGYQKEVYSLNEFNYLFSDMIDEVIEWNYQEKKNID